MRALWLIPLAAIAAACTAASTGVDVEQSMAIVGASSGPTTTARLDDRPPEPQPTSFEGCEIEWRLAEIPSVNVTLSRTESLWAIGWRR